MHFSRHPEIGSAISMPKSPAVRRIETGLTYQWIAPETAAGKRFRVLFSNAQIYVVKYLNDPLRVGELVLTRQFLDAKIFDLIRVHLPG